MPGRHGNPPVIPAPEGRDRASQSKLARQTSQEDEFWVCLRDCASVIRWKINGGRSLTSASRCIQHVYVRPHTRQNCICKHRHTAYVHISNGHGWSQQLQVTWHRWAWWQQRLHEGRMGQSTRVSCLLYREGMWWGGKQQRASDRIRQHRLCSVTLFSPRMQQETCRSFSVWCPALLCGFVETSPRHAALAGLELTILLPLPPKRCNLSPGPPHLALPQSESAVRSGLMLAAPACPQEIVSIDQRDVDGGNNQSGESERGTEGRCLRYGSDTSSYSSWKASRRHLTFYN